jgi:hypothetical protein
MLWPERCAVLGARSCCDPFHLYDLVVMAEAAYNFSRGLRSRHRDDKDFLRPGKAGAPSLRARAEAMVARSREVTAPPASHETTQGWIAKFKETATETHALMRQLGMSLFDREYIDEHLVHGMPLGKLPVLEYINAHCAGWSHSPLRYAKRRSGGRRRWRK